MQNLVRILANPVAFWCGIGLATSFASLALFAPNAFRRLATGGSTWVDTSKWLELLDRRIEVDAFFLRNPRVFGAVLLGGVGLAFALFISRL